MIAFVLSLALGIPPMLTSATICDPDDPNICAMVLIPGQEAPFAGTLMSPDLAIRLGQKANDCEELQGLDANRRVKLCEIDLNAAQAQIERDNQAMIKISHLAQDAANKCQKELDAAEPAFYEKPLFVALVSSILSGGLVAYLTLR